MVKDPVEAQREFYASRRHDHLQPQSEDIYSARLVARLVEAIGLVPEARVLEVGAGFGRFTFELLAHCESLVALDLSEEALARLASARDERGISVDRCRTLCADLQEVDLTAQETPFDFIVGCFILHHLPDYRDAIRRLVPSLRPGGGMAFIEPNRRNPLFAAQVAFCQDMSWAEEKGMFRLSSRGVLGACEAAGLETLPDRRFGFFPPQVIYRWPAASRLEARIERVGVMEPLLPFLFVGARAPHRSFGSSG